MNNSILTPFVIYDLDPYLTIYIIWRIAKSTLQHRGCPK